MKYSCTGLFLPDVLHWSGEAFPPRASAQTRLFYPGTIAALEEALPSVRLKRLRRGLQDILYLRILRQRQRPVIAQTVIDAMARYGGLDAAGDHYLDPRLDGWVQDAATWDAARAVLAAEILDVLRPSGASGRRALERRLAWRRFDEQAHSVRVERVRTRVAPVLDEAGRPTGRLRMTLTLELYNEHSRDVDVAARIESLPAGWKAVDETAGVAPFRAGGRAAVELTARGAYVPGMADAKLPVAVSLTAGRRRQDLTAHVALLLAGEAKTPPRIDGVLDDWPLRVGNAAGGFRLLGRRGRQGDGLARRQTDAFVLHDRENLYIAFRCEEPEADSLVARASNLVGYEQLMACGEDLVEVILDPGADARGVEGLYHVVVKANGVLVAERGVGTSPPLGEARPWAVAAAVAVGRGAGAWFVELRIPLSAFGAEGQASVWGANFARFAVRGAEASSWSGARRYFYDPRNLGTMFLAPGER
jgi:hypothetical protein